MNFLLKLSDLKLNFTLTLGYLNPALNNAALNFPAPCLLLYPSSVHHSFKRFFEKFLSLICSKQIKANFPKMLKI